MRKIRAASSKCRGPNAAQRAFEFDARLSRCAHARPRSSLSAGSTRTQQEVVGSLLTLATRSSSLTSSKTRSSSAHPSPADLAAVAPRVRGYRSGLGSGLFPATAARAIRTTIRLSLVLKCTVAYVEMSASGFPRRFTVDSACRTPDGVG